MQATFTLTIEQGHTLRLRVWPLLKTEILRGSKVFTYYTFTLATTLAMDESALTFKGRAITSKDLAVNS